jgi:N-acetylglucosaminyldiphosphoundecaprenol N-acetyl-beta-D-mannosaminyltransferase
MKLDIENRSSQFVSADEAGAPLAQSPVLAGGLFQAGTNMMHQPITSTARLTLMGGELDPVTPAQVMAFIARRVERRRKAIIANHNMHSLYLQTRHSGMADYFSRADLIQIDSVPLILWGKALGQPIERAHQSTYLNWRDSFWSLAAERGWRVYLLGSAPGVVDRTIQKMNNFWPGVVLAGRDGYFDHGKDSAANAAVVQAINDFRPDVVLVGMGMPLQERWIQDNIDRLETGVYLSVGGAFDYEAGVQTPAPRWVGRMGLEWLFRFCLNPKRLFSRYFVEPWGLMGVAMEDVRRAMKGRPLAPSLTRPASSSAER